jgi:hypothetical protein
MDAILAAIQNSAFAASVRDSTFVYPVANVTHVVAVIAFFGLVATMDLRLLGVSGGASASTLINRVRPLALVAFVLIVAAGLILFSAEAVALARNTAFQLKIAAIVLALANIGVNEWTLRRYGEGAGIVRTTAGISLVAWLFVAAMGRTIAYV